MTTDRYMTRAEYSQLKRRLTVAERSGDPTKVLAECRQFCLQLDGRAWPDDWARWARAYDDAARALSKDCWELTR